MCAIQHVGISKEIRRSHQCLVMTSVIGTVDAGRDRNAGTHMIGAWRDSMHLVVCIKQVPDFCANSRRFSDEHDHHAPWKAPHAPCLPIAQTIPVRVEMRSPLKNVRHCNRGILRSSPQRPIGEETRRRADDCRSHMTLSVAFVGSSTQVVPSTIRPISRCNYLKKSN